MFTLRRPHLDALTALRREAFVEDACRHLRRHFASALEAHDDHSLRSEVDRAIDRAARHGLESERDVYRYLHLCVCAGWRFEEQGRFAELVALLDDGGISQPSRRIESALDAFVSRAETERENRARRERFAFGGEPWGLAGEDG